MIFSKEKKVMFVLYGVLFFVNSLLFSQAKAVDPEIQRYFETQYGYMKQNDFRNSPVSTVSTDIKTELSSKNSLITYTVLPQADYTSLPLHYDIKKQNTSGSISSYVLKPSESQNKVKSYILLDITISKKVYSSVISSLSKYGFIYAGEENFIDKSKDTLTIFGWVDEKYFNEVSKIKNIDKISLSKREITAPLSPVTLFVRVPNNRDIVVFSDKFVSKLSEYGFVKNDLEIISNDKKYRFTVLKINGLIPIDKTSLLLKYPFVIEANS